MPVQKRGRGQPKGSKNKKTKYLLNATTADTPQVASDIDAASDEITQQQPAGRPKKSTQLSVQVRILVHHST